VVRRMLVEAAPFTKVRFPDALDTSLR
jgi:hypothetical protein